MKAEISSEGTFQDTLHEILEGKQPIDALLAHPKFRLRGMRICARIQRNELLDADAEDLFQDVCLRVLKYGPVAPNLNNIPDEDKFFAWLFVVALNISRSKIRKMKQLIDPTPVEELNMPDPSVDLDKNYLLIEFLERIRTLPDYHQLAIKSWLEGYSYREITRMLNGEGVECSHSTISNWIRDAVINFSGVNSSSATKPLLKKIRK